MPNLRRPYQMYVLNLDAGRIFWITTILLLLLALSFFAGLLVGKEKARSESELISQKNKQVVEELLSKVKSEEVQEESEEDYQFYDLMHPDKEKSVQTIQEEERPEERVKIAEKIEKPVIKKEYEPYMEVGDTKISPNRPYAIQIASYTKYNNAKLLNNYLKSEQYPVYIIKSKVNNTYYYRVRVGPFSSKALTLKVLAQLKLKKECENSFIVGN